MLRQAGRSLVCYAMLAGGIGSLAWFSQKVEAVPLVILSPWDMDSSPLVVLDAGHGGHDGGAVAGGVVEKNLALKLTLQIRENLIHHGVRVKMTRDEDVFIPLEERANMANAAEADAFVSVHLNTSGKEEVSGVETYFTGRKSLSVQRTLQARWSLASGTSVQDDRGRWLAESLQKEVCRYIQAIDRGVKERSYAVVSQTAVPAALIECGFLTHKGEANKLKDEAYQKQLTEGITAGILLFIKARTSHPERGVRLMTGPPSAPEEVVEGNAP